MTAPTDVTRSDLVHIRLDVVYDGRAYRGFQIQNNGPTIQNELERAFQVLFRKPVRVRGASRTDTGVHAEGQVVLVRMPREGLDLSRILTGLNAILPRDIGIKRLTPVTADFDPINSAKAKVYRYRFWQGRCHNPFISPYVWPVYPHIDVAMMQEQLQAVCGEHDFTSFCNSDSDVATTVRRIRHAVVRSRGAYVEMWLLGDGFLKQQVRIIAGTLVDIVHGRLKNSMSDIIAARERAAAGRTAPAQGLALVEIFYDTVPELTEWLSAEADFSWSVL